MHKMPYKTLPAKLRDILHREFELGGWALPHLVTVQGEASYIYYMKIEDEKSNFVIEFDTKTSLYKKITAGRGNDYYRQPTKIDRDKIKKTLNKNNLVVKGYLNHSNYTASMVVLYHPTQLPKPIPEVTVSERERRLLYAFGFLKEGIERKEALIRLSATQEEIDSLIVRGILKNSKGSPTITNVGELIRLSPKDQNPLVIDQW